MRQIYKMYQAIKNTNSSFKIIITSVLLIFLLYSCDFKHGSCVCVVNIRELKLSQTALEIKKKSIADESIRNRHGQSIS